MNSHYSGTGPSHHRAPGKGPTKLDGARWSVNFAVSLALSLAACHPPRVAPSPPPGEWTTALGDPTRSAYADDTIGTNLSIAWRVGVDPGLAAPLQVHGEVLIATTAGRAVIAMNAETGMRYWSRRYNGPIAGSALRRDDVVYIATGDRENRVHALDIRRGRGRWSKRIGEVRLEPLLTDSGIVVVTETGRVISLATSDGEEQWSARLDAPPALPPVRAAGLIMVATARDTLYAIDPASGAIRHRLALDGAPSAAAVVRDDLLVVPLASRRVVGIRLTPEPAVAWSADVPEPVDATPVRIGDDFFVLDRAADVWRISATGTILRIADLDGAASGSFTAVGNRIVVGRLDGRLDVLNTEGDVVASLDLDDSIIAPVAAIDGVMWVPLLRGDIVRIEG
jgi:outer membrane protein assembly factor BamB